MAALKTQVTTKNPNEFLSNIEPAQKQADAFTLLSLFEKITGEKPRMWGESMIGYGSYHYKSERSSQEGDWFLTGFSPRKQNLTLYILHGNQKSAELLKKLGKHKTSSGGMGGCLYINKLSDVELEVLTSLIETSYQFMKKTTAK